MNIVIDTNILFSALLKEDHAFLNCIFLSDLHFFSVNAVAVEIFKHKEKICKLTSLDENSVLEVLARLFSRITLINMDLISEESRKRAFDLCKDIDPKDSVFVALAIEIDGFLWTGDKKLIQGLQNSGFSRFFSP